MHASEGHSRQGARFGMRRRALVAAVCIAVMALATATAAFGSPGIVSQTMITGNPARHPAVGSNWAAWTTANYSGAYGGMMGTVGTFSLSTMSTGPTLIPPGGIQMGSVSFSGDTVFTASTTYPVLQATLPNAVVSAPVGVGAWSPSISTVSGTRAAAAAGTTIRVYDLTNGAVLYQVTGVKDTAYAFNTQIWWLRAFDLDGDHLAYVTGPNTTSGDLMVKDVSTGSLHQIATGVGSARISGRRIVYSTSDGIYCATADSSWSSFTIVKITGIVWPAYGTVFGIGDFDVSGDNVVYGDSADVLHIRNLSTNQDFVIGPGGHPSIEGNKLVYVGWNGYGVYLARLATAPVISVAAPTADAEAGKPYQRALSITDPDPGIVALTVNWGDGAISNYPAIPGPLMTSHVYASPGDFTVTVNAVDSFGLPAATQSFSVHVGAVAEVRPDSYQIDEDAILQADVQGGVLANDTLPSDSAAIVQLASAPQGGDLTLNPDGSFTFAPVSNWSGSASFSYLLVADGQAYGPASVVIDVLPVPDSPTPGADSYTTDEDTVLTVPSTGVLGNDTDADGDGLTASLQAQPTKGTVVFNADGSFTYTPNTNAVGTDRFTYSVSDGTQSAAADVGIEIIPVQDPPVGHDDTYSTNEHAALTVEAAGLLENDADADGDALSATLLSGPQHGALSLDADGSFIYTPEGHWNGVDEFTYQVSDGFAQSAPVKASISVAAVNDPPAILSFGSVSAPVPIGQEVSAQISIDDPDAGDTCTWTVEWSDGTRSTGVANGAAITATHTYSMPGVYKLIARVTDCTGATASSSWEYVVVYDPTAGFVTGGGWFDSPAGAYMDDPDVTGKATFGFVAKYAKGASIPSGQTDFEFTAGGIRFVSTSYEWLCVAGSRAQFKGFGTLNGVAGYRFILSCSDGVQDALRIRITKVTDDSVVYDNMPAESSDSPPNVLIGGGNIVIHRPTK